MTGEEFMAKALALVREFEKTRGQPLSSRSAEQLGAAAFGACQSLYERITKLQSRVDELEKYPFTYDGPHETGKTYRKGIFVTHGGSLWHANYTTASTPGDGPAWTLAVKRGRDAR